MLPNTSTSSFFAPSGASHLGLEQTDGKVGRVRKAPVSGPPKRDGPVWATVTIIREHATSPSVKCINCGKEFCGGVTRIADHITDMGEIG